MQHHTKFNRNTCCSLTYATQGKRAKMARSVRSSLYEFRAKKVKHKQEENLATEIFRQIKRNAGTLQNEHNSVIPHE